MWVIQFNVLRGGERSPEDGAPREFLNPNSPFPLPDIDQTVLHRGEAFVVDDVIWDLERKTVTVELVPPDEVEARDPTKPAAEAEADPADGDDFEDLDFDGDAPDGEEGDEAEGDETEDFAADPEPQGEPGEPEAPEAPPADKRRPPAPGAAPRTRPRG